MQKMEKLFVSIIQMENGYLVSENNGDVGSTSGRYFVPQQWVARNEVELAGLIQDLAGATHKRINGAVAF